MNRMKGVMNHNEKIELNVIVSHLEKVLKKLKVFQKTYKTFPVDDNTGGWEKVRMTGLNPIT